MMSVRYHKQSFETSLLQHRPPKLLAHYLHSPRTTTSSSRVHWELPPQVIEKFVNWTGKVSSHLKVRTFKSIAEAVPRKRAATTAIKRTEVILHVAISYRRLSKLRVAVMKNPDFCLVVDSTILLTAQNAVCKSFDHLI